MKTCIPPRKQTGPKPDVNKHAWSHAWDRCSLYIAASYMYYACARTRKFEIRGIGRVCQASSCLVM